jgi:hypothetical protein
MRRAYLAVSSAALVLTACGSTPEAAPSPSPAALIADTAMDVATCHQFAAEQAGLLSADEFDRWLVRHGGQLVIGPDSATGMDNTLSTNLGDWYAVHASAPSGDLQPAAYYAAEVLAECRSIGA